MAQSLLCNGNKNPCLGSHNKVWSGAQLCCVCLEKLHIISDLEWKRTTVGSPYQRFCFLQFQFSMVDAGWKAVNGRSPKETIYKFSIACLLSSVAKSRAISRESSLPPASPRYVRSRAPQPSWLSEPLWRWRWLAVVVSWPPLFYFTGAPKRKRSDAGNSASPKRSRKVLLLRENVSAVQCGILCERSHPHDLYYSILS